VQFSVRWIEMLAISIVVYQTTGSALLVTFMALLRVLPMALFGAFIGAVSDRIEGRTAMIVTASVQLLTSTSIALLAFSGTLETWHLAVSVFVNGVVWAGDNAFRRVMIGRVVGVDGMSHAMTFDIGAANVSRMAGPAIGGAVLATWGIGACFVVGAALYISSLTAALTLRYRHNQKLRNRGLILQGILDALRLIKGDYQLIGILAITVIFNLFAFPILSLVPVIGHDNLMLGPGAVGLLASMEGFGAIAGVIMMFVFADPRHQATLYTIAVPSYLLSLICFALLPNASLAGVALFIAGFGGSGFAVTQSALMFRSVSLEMRARMLGLLSVTIGTGPIGFVQIGWLSDVMGAKNAIVMVAIEGLFALVLTSRYWRAIK
jgi:MFS family permease